MKYFSNLARGIAPMVLAASCLAGAGAQANDGLEFEAVYKGEVWTLASGGQDKGTSYLHNFDASVTADLETMLGWSGATFFAYGLANNDASFTGAHVGDLQTVSNIDNTGMYRLYEVWLEQRFADGNASLKLGAIDLNSEFDAIDTAGLFFNASHGIGPDFSQSGQNGPSIFPTTSLAVRLDYSAEKWAVRFGVFDAVPGDPDRPRRNVFKFGDDEGALIVGEANYTPTEDLRFGVGYWHYTAEFDAIEQLDTAGQPAMLDGNNGLYGFMDYRVFSESGDSDRGLNIFARYGRANDDINQVDSYLGIGGVYTGLLRSRPGDQLGLAVAIASNGDPFKRIQAAASNPVNDTEINVELTYNMAITPWLTLQPDFQYIVNPSMDPTVKDAVVFGLRFELSFGG